MNLAGWMERQRRVFLRYCRRYGVDLAPDLVLSLAPRFAARSPGGGLTTFLDRGQR